MLFRGSRSAFFGPAESAWICYFFAFFWRGQICSFDKIEWAAGPRKRLRVFSGARNLSGFAYSERFSGAGKFAAPRGSKRAPRLQRAPLVSRAPRLQAFPAAPAALAPQWSEAAAAQAAPAAADFRRRRGRAEQGTAAERNRLWPRRGGRTEGPGREANERVLPSICRSLVTFV